LTDSIQSLSYPELAEQSLVLAAALQKHYPNSTRFLISAEHQLDFLRNWLAMMAAGMIAIPYHPALPELQLEKLKIQFKAQTLALDLPPNLEANFNQELLPISVQNTCLALLTSGSSGEVKAACFQPFALFWNAQSVMCYQNLSEPGKMAIHLPLNHAFGLVTQVLPALLAQSPLSFLPRNLWPGDLLNLLREQEISTFASVPSTLRLLLQGKPEPLLSIQHLSIAGAALHPEEIPALQACFPKAQIWIGYGLTEAGPRVSAFSNHDPNFKSGSAGYPLPEIEIKIVNDEIWLRSPSLMQGYLEAAALNAQSLNNGWLKTGDSGYLSLDQQLFITGRLDDTLLTGGEKVAPLAVERALLQEQSILHVAVYGEEDPVLGCHLVALLEPKPETRLPSLHALRRFCRNVLEPHQIPRYFYRVDSLPLTPNGKIRRKELAIWPKTPWF
jgi:acyl-CoA synthetase (AMP-forming)/AMP-acid ligase II